MNPTARTRRASSRWTVSLALSALALTLGEPLAGQALSTPETGPVIEGYGSVFEVLTPDMPTPLDHTYRVVFDVSQTPEGHDQHNRSIETLARFLNMHGRAGVPTERMKLALVLHGGAGKDALSDEAYQSRYGAANPNTALLAALKRAGVEIVLCGQTAASRGFGQEELSAPVDLALSAMTALALYQSRGYGLIAF